MMYYDIRIYIYLKYMKIYRIPIYLVEFKNINGYIKNHISMDVGKLLLKLYFIFF